MNQTGKHTLGKKLLALLMALTMAVSLLPVSVLAAELDAAADEPAPVAEVPAEPAAEPDADAAAMPTTQATTVNDDTDYLFVATDRHANTSIVGNLINSMESQIGENQLDYLVLGGDMVGSGGNHPAYNSSTVLAEVTAATSSLNKDNVDIVAGIHDTNVNDDAGIVLPYQGGGKQIYEGKNFYVYGVEEYCVSNAATAQTEAAKFVTWANSVSDTSKAIIVVSHYPLHAKRGDNVGAGYWHNALNTVATGSATGTEVIRNVVFFHGHNHTTDSAEYVSTVGSTMSIESYVSPATATVQTATGTAVYDAEYGTYAMASGTYATIYYTYATAGYLNAQKDATLVTITDSTITLDKYTTSGYTTKATITRVAGGSAEPDPTPTPDAAVKDETTGVTVAGSGATEVTVENKTNDTNVQAALTGKLTRYAAYDITLTGYTDGTEVAVTLPIPEGVTEPVVYYVPTSGEPENMNATDNGDGTVSFTTKHFSVYAVGQAATAETGDGETTLPPAQDVEVEAGTATTADVWVQTSTLTSGQPYLIVNTNTAGSGHALTNNGSITDTAVTVQTDVNGKAYIATGSVTDGMKWTATGSNASWSFANIGSYLATDDSFASHSLTLSTTEKTWTLGTNALYYSWLLTYYLKYSENNWKVAAGSSNVYFYQLDTVTTDSGSQGGTYSIAGTDVTKAVVKGDTAELESKLTFTPDDDGGTVKTETVSTKATYEVVKGTNIITVDGNTATFTGEYGEATVKVSYEIEGARTVINYFTVTANAPVFAVDIVDSEGKSITDTITIKGMVEGDTYQLKAKVTYTADNETKELENVEPAKLSWKSSNASVATVDENGKVTFVGEGTAQITVYYAYANGSQATDTVTFSVTKSNLIIPSDGTNDFPQYPNEGAVRFNKTASAVGSFSQTGIAQVELSMTGVPYSTGSEIDVVMMLDMTGSMTDTEGRLPATKAAAKAFLEKIVKNEDGTFNDNRIAIYSFNKSGATTVYDLNKVASSTALSTIESTIDDLSTTSGGTPYATALKRCYDTLNSAKTEGRQQFCLFMSDGVPTTYQYSSAASYETSSIQGMFTGTDYNTRSSSAYKYEYYSTQMKANGVTVYTVGLGLNAKNSAWSGKSATACLNAASILLNDISGPANESSQPDAVGTTTLSKANQYFFSVEDASSVENSEMTKVFQSIAKSIRQAATDVEVVDKIADEYTMNFKLPTGVTSTTAGRDEFYIQVVEYTLDETTHERTDNPTVLENFTFNADGTLQSHTVNGVTCGDTCNHVTTTNGVITKIKGTYFTYEVKDDGEFLIWKSEKLTSNELALQYFVYLENSAGTAAADQVAAGSYPTNEYATLTYTNHLGNKVQQTFPVPQLTWNGAQVSYVFYLVNDQGQPVNSAGRVVDFANAVYVTDPVTFSVTWNKEEGSENLLAHDLFAKAGVPSVYTLYDENAYYGVRVYQTEGVDKDTEAVNYNYFQISGTAEPNDTVKTLTTTKVFNNRAGTKYDSYGVYSEQPVGTVLNTTDADGNATTVIVTKQTSGLDYANTTVAFAVKWIPTLKEDTVVIDFGLDVVIDVTTNDTVNVTSVTGVMATAPTNVAINKGTYKAKDKVGKDSITGGDGVWEAKKENDKNVRFHLDKMISDPAVFYYEADVSYYSGKDTQTLTTEYMYSSVTVIPATTVYYEDGFVTFTSYTKSGDEWLKDDASQWTTDGTTTSATQAVDRPGTDIIKEGYDANNVYGYDKAYEECTTFSMGSAKKITVNENTYGTATFTFKGTGFDVISLTDNNSGAIIVDVYKGKEATGTTVKSLIVDNYYGYKQVTDSETGEVTWVVDKESKNCLYQIPVMKVAGLSYDEYTVAVKVFYDGAFDHTAAGNAYSFWLDAIRVYDPVDSSNTVANDAYKADNEAYPQYIKLRDALVDSQAEFEAVFIDGGSTAEIATYANYGPNNEVYLANGQAISFTVPTNGKIKSIQIGAKSPNGTATMAVNQAVNQVEAKTLSTATEMYYTIGTAGGSFTITNTGEGILSLTNLKITYSEKDTITLVALNDAAQTAAVQMVRALFMVAADPEPEVFVPEQFEADWNRSTVRAGQKATLTVKTSEDVESITVNGQVIDTYRTRTQRTGWGSNATTVTYRQFTYTVTAAETADYAVVAYNANGVASEAVTATLTVQAAQSSGLAGWLESIFGRWF